MNRSQEYIPAPKYAKDFYSGSGAKDRVFIDRFPIEKIQAEDKTSDRQKEIDYNQVADMLLNFDDKLWEPILLDGEYYLLDGYHRIELARLLRLRYIDVIIESDEATLRTIRNQDESSQASQGIESVEEFASEQTTVWDFPKRGAWATHRPDYRGNFAPQVARNVLLNYSQESELVLDPMVGSGTTLIEARLLNRNAIGYDINQNAVEITKARLNFSVNNQSRQVVSVGDVRKLSQLNDNSVDIILTHPPYANIITYSNRKNPDDLSSIADIDNFMDQLEVGLQELIRVLKPNRYCAILMGDTRKGQHYVPSRIFY